MVDEAGRQLGAGMEAVARGSTLSRWAPVLVGIAYYAGSLVGFALRLPGSGISFLWPPTAILVAALLLAPPRAWPRLLGAALIAHGIAHTADGLPVTIWATQFAANAVQAVCGGVLVRRYLRGSVLFRDLRSVAIFIVGAALVAPAVASVIASFAYVQMGWALDLTQAWRARLLSNFIAALTIVPPIVMTYQRIRSGTGGFPFRRSLKFAALLAALIVTCGVAMALGREDLPGVRPVLYLPLPFLLWAAVGFGPAELSAALLCTTLLTVSSVIRGIGPFAGSETSGTIVAVQLFVSVTVVPLMLLAGLLEESRRERRALVENEERTTAILRAIPDLMFLQSRDGVYLNYYASNLTELLVPPEAFLGRNMHDVLPPALAATLACAFQEVTVEAPSLLEYSLVVAGARRHYESRLIALEDGRILSMVRDITERAESEAALRESERRYALATASGGVGVWEADLLGGQLYVDPALKRALGYADSDLTSMANAWNALVHPADLQRLMSSMRAHARGASASMEVEHRMIHRDGSIHWFLTKGELADGSDSGTIRIAGTSTDITARKQAENALAQAQGDLARMAKLTAIGELTVSIAHEVNQPLCAIVANANASLNWLQRPGSEDEVRSALVDIVQDGHRASQIIKRTRELFTKRPAQRRPLDLNGIAREVLDIARERLRQNGVNLELRLAPDLPLVHADDVQIQQVLMNLVQNGVDAMRDVTDRPRVLRVRSRAEGGQAIVSVRDTGAGLPSADAERVFEPFFTTKPDGIGIGLAISRSIVASHGGVLWATANPQAGATFRFRIPAVSDEHG